MDDARPYPRPGAVPAPAVDRTAHRHKTFEPITLVTERGDLRAHVLNVSTTGALIHAAGGPAAGERCTLFLAGREVAAEVIWVGGPRFGVAFRGALTPDELARLLG